MANLLPIEILFGYKMISEANKIVVKKNIVEGQIRKNTETAVLFRVFNIQTRKNNELKSKQKGNK
jgi:hypothetical protein|tara:strand:+ start:37929 stop:38123 length:195 start_codon:yes stop_codon:yes gene_type:complete